MIGDNRNNSVHKVAIVVLVEHPGYDDWDAAHAAEAAVYQGLTGKESMFMDEEFELPSLKVNHETWAPGVVKHIMPLNAAISNGLLKVLPGNTWK